MCEVHRLPAPQISFSLQTAGRLMTEVFPAWVQDLALLVESVETVRPPGALLDWQPGATVRLNVSKGKNQTTTVTKTITNTRTRTHATTATTPTTTQVTTTTSTSTVTTVTTP